MKEDNAKRVGDRCLQLTRLCMEPIRPSLHLTMLHEVIKRMLCVAFEGSVLCLLNFARSFILQRSLPKETAISRHVSVCFVYLSVVLFRLVVSARR